MHLKQRFKIHEVKTDRAQKRNGKIPSYSVGLQHSPPSNDSTTRKKVIKDVENLNNTINKQYQFKHTHILYPTTAQYRFFSKCLWIIQMYPGP